MDSKTVKKRQFNDWYTGEELERISFPMGGSAPA